MEIISLNQSDIAGGASRAAFRIHEAMRDQGVNSKMFVNQARRGDWTVFGPEGDIAKAIAQVRGPLVTLITRSLKTKNLALHSPAIIPSRWNIELNKSNADCIHLHWINKEMISIADIGKIKKPIVWTIHDMWPFCGAEHLTQDYRWRDGYLESNRPSYESGFDLCGWTAKRKFHHWKRLMHIVAPSAWIANCARESLLMREWPITIIPNPLNTDIWSPFDKDLARSLMGLPNGVPLVLFGAIGGTSDPNKGFELLRDALRHLRGACKELELVIFGESSPKHPYDLGFKMHFMGHLSDDVSLRLLYSAADILVVSSRIESFCQIASEAHACGTPVVAFGATGLLDVVDHKKTGYLAKPYDPVELAEGIQWLIQDPNRLKEIGKEAREKAIRTWSYEKVSPQYLEVYKNSLIN